MKQEKIHPPIRVACTLVVTAMVAGEKAEEVSGLLLGVAEDFALGQRLLQLVNLCLGEVGIVIERQLTSSGSLAPKEAFLSPHPIESESVVLDSRKQVLLQFSKRPGHYS